MQKDIVFILEDYLYKVLLLLSQQEQDEIYMMAINYKEYGIEPNHADKYLNFLAKEIANYPVADRSDRLDLKQG